MITGIDRIQVASFDAEEVAGRWIGLLGGQTLAEDRVACLNARRLMVAVGDSVVEVLEPLGPGPVEDHLRSQKGGPFAAGMAVANLDKLQKKLTGAGIAHQFESEQVFLDEQQLGIQGLRLVLSPQSGQQPVGRLQTLYEVTHLTADPAAAAARLAEVLALDADDFVPIESEAYGYRGILTLFNAPELDRIEMIFPHDATTTMGRYYQKFGASLYMCFGECDEMGALRDALAELVPHDWTGPDSGDVDSLFIHPVALGGVMLGVSRTNFAWSWSGSPDRVTN